MDTELMMDEMWLYVSKVRAAARNLSAGGFGRGEGHG